MNTIVDKSFKGGLVSAAVGSVLVVLTLILSEISAPQSGFYAMTMGLGLVLLVVGGLGVLLGRSRPQQAKQAQKPVVRERELASDRSKIAEGKGFFSRPEANQVFEPVKPIEVEVPVREAVVVELTPQQVIDQMNRAQLLAQFEDTVVAMWCNSIRGSTNVASLTDKDLKALLKQIHQKAHE